jgi:hypothetical protein
MKTRKTWVALILLSLSIVSVSAFVYESAQQSVDQTIRDIATFSLKDSTLGDIEEGETKTARAISNNTITNRDIRQVRATISEGMGNEHAQQRIYPGREIPL